MSLRSLHCLDSHLYLARRPAAPGMRHHHHSVSMSQPMSGCMLQCTWTSCQRNLRLQGIRRPLVNSLPPLGTLPHSRSVVGSLSMFGLQHVHKCLNTVTSTLCSRHLKLRRLLGTRPHQVRN